MLVTLFYGDLPYIAYPLPFLKFLNPSPPNFPVTSNRHPQCQALVPLYLIPSIRRALICVLWNKVSSLLRSDT